MKQSYVPDQGDIVWLNFSPQKGHEQGGWRPALVLSPITYNRKTGLSIFCPITSRIKGYPFEVSLPEGGEMRGVVLSDHVKNLDWRARGARFHGKIPKSLLAEAIEKLTTLVSIKQH